MDVYEFQCASHRGFNHRTQSGDFVHASVLKIALDSQQILSTLPLSNLQANRINVRQDTGYIGYFIIIILEY